MKKIVRKLIPKSLKSLLSAHYAGAFKRNHSENYSRWELETPIVELEDKHLKNAKILPNRISMIEKLAKDGVVAELGVDTGDFSKIILNYTKPQKLHLIDAWDTARYNLNKRSTVEEKFSKQIEFGKIEINCGYSTEVVTQFENAYFDWIYIDTNHSYNTTKKELNLYAPKIKEGGIIAGHDYERANWKGLVKYGVIEAVHEFCVLNNWEFVYLTMENKEHKSFAIRRIRNVLTRKDVG